MKKITDAAGIAIFVLTVLTVCAILMWPGVVMVAEKGGTGTDWLAPLGALKFPFRGMIPGLMTLLGGGAVMIVYALLFRVLMVPLDRIYWAFVRLVRRPRQDRGKTRRR